MPPPPPILRVERLTKTYATAAGRLTVLHGVSFELEAGATLAIVGPSGSGKTTLLGLCAGLDRATSGAVSLAGEALDFSVGDQPATAKPERADLVRDEQAVQVPRRDV